MLRALSLFFLTYPWIIPIQYLYWERPITCTAPISCGKRFSHYLLNQNQFNCLEWYKTQHLNKKRAQIYRERRMIKWPEKKRIEQLLIFFKTLCHALLSANSQGKTAFLTKSSFLNSFWPVSSDLAQKWIKKRFPPAVRTQFSANWM